MSIPYAGFAFNGGFIESVSGNQAIVIRSNATIERTTASLPKGPYRDYVSRFGVSNAGNLSSAASCFAREGATFVLRLYASARTEIGGAAMTRGEAQALSAAGLKVAVLYFERVNATAEEFTASSGTQQATRAIQFANNVRPTEGQRDLLCSGLRGRHGRGYPGPDHRIF